MGRRKSDADRRDEQLHIRVTAAQKALLTAAAQAEGHDVSTWLRGLGLREARRLGVEVNEMAPSAAHSTPEGEERAAELSSPSDSHPACGRDEKSR